MTHKFEVGDCVYYGLNSFKTERAKYRVTGHYKKVYEEPLIDDPSDPVNQIIRKLNARQRAEAVESRLEQGLPADKRYYLKPCVPDEATHLGLSGVAGAQAPIEECEFIGLVSWDLDDILEDRERALRRVDWPDHRIERYWYWE